MFTRIEGSKRNHGAKSGGKVLPAYRSWQMMKNRCTNPNAMDWAYYGGKGITVDERWLSYNEFIADMGHPPTGHTLDRVDTDKGYSKDNCRWATRKTQSRNRDYCLDLTCGGVTRKTWEWAEHLGISQKTIYYRLWQHKTNPAMYPWESVFRPRMKGAR